MFTKDTLPWRLRSVPPTAEGALSSAQKSQLADTYGLDAKALLDLSVQLNSALAEQLNMTQPELAPSKHQKGLRKLDSAIQDLRVAERKLAAANDAVSDLRFKNPYAYAGVPSPADRHIAALRKVISFSTEAREFFETMRRHELVSYTGQPDKRRTRDERRTMICTAIFNCWLENGGNLSFTTDPITSERGGPLVDFVNSVVFCITDPPSCLNGEAIRTELQDFKSYAEKHRTSDRV